MARPLFASGQLCDSSTVSASSTAGTLEASNVLTPRTDEVWRSDDAGGSHTLTFALPAAADIDFVAIRGNLSADAQWRVRFSTSEGGLATPDLTTGWLDNLTGGGSAAAPVIVFHKLSTAASAATWMAVDIDDAANADGFTQVVRVLAAVAYQPGRGVTFAQPAEINRVDPSIRSRSIGGQVAMNRRTQYRTMAFGLRYLTEADAFDGWDALREYVGESRDLLVTLDPDDANAARVRTRQTLHGYLTSGRPVGSPVLGHWDVPVNVEEIV